MKLIGTLDSPYVRRVAISLHWLGLSFDHEPLSALSAYAEFQAINPQVKAPTLVLNDGRQLMDSTLILDFAETVSEAGQQLMTTDPEQRIADLHCLGIALAVADTTLRLHDARAKTPASRQPSRERLRAQLHAGCTRLNMLSHQRGTLLTSATLSQAWLTSAVVWRSIVDLLPDELNIDHYPTLQQLSSEAEALPEFVRYPPADPDVTAST